jgi:hypothetical protein
MFDEFEQEDSPEEEAKELLEALGERLQKLANEQIAIREVVQTRWLDDLDQYMGRYDSETLARLEQSGGSKAFVNITRPKTLQAESRLADMLLPTDDKNWAIQLTPVPEFHAALNNHRVVSNDEQGNPVTVAQIAMKEMRKPCLAMESEIDDQLTECNYHRTAREVIHDACLFGTGIIKAPVIVEKVTKKWQKLQGAVHELTANSQFVPSAERVEVWNFFPDMAAHHIDDCEFVLERRYVSKSQLLKLAKNPAYDSAAIKKVISEKRNYEANNSGTHISRLRDSSDLNISLNKNRFELWEYWGAISSEDLSACGHDVDDMGEHNAVVCFINGVVIKGDLNADETGDNPYSMFIYEKDDSSIFGLGVPFLLRNEQRIANAAWRMALDNAALTTGPQIIVNRELVIPSDGNWDLKPKKVWWLNSEVGSVRDVFATHDINGHQAELINLYELAKGMADDVTNMPLIAQGDSNAAPDTATGTSMLMNAANATLRRVVKYFDDNITEPVITRFYNWNMQNSDKEAIKGDFNVDARGSSALLVKETQNHALLNLLSISESPTYSPLTKHAELYRKAVQAQHINADDVIKTDEEIAADAQKPDPQQQQLAQLQIEKLTEEVANLKLTGNKIIADTAVQNVDALFGSMNTAEKVALMPEIAIMGDEISKSAGFIDHDGGSIVTPQSPPTEQQEAQNGSEQRQEQEQNPTETEMLGNQVEVLPPPEQNTHPQFPPNPDVGMMAGIDS